MTKLDLRGMAAAVKVFVGGLVVAVVSTVGVAAFAQSAMATPIIVVDSVGDGADADLGDDVCATSRGECTLRAAIATANARPGSDVIHFAIPGAGPHTIRPGSELPAIDDATGWLRIDGYTQPRARANTAEQGSNADIRIQLRGNRSWGLRLLSSENTVRGLAIGGFSTNIEVNFEAADGNRIVGNFIGLDAAGRRVSGSKFGIRVRSGPDRNIFGTPALEDRNVVSGNEWGITIEHGISSENLVQNNVIGLLPGLDGSAPQSAGVDIQWGSWGNMVGGFEPGEGNLISGNERIGDWRGGVDLSHDAVGNLIVGNHIGTLGDGNTATSYSANRYGIVVKDNAHRNYIADNVIVNSNLDGIGMRHNFTGSNVWVGNRIGVGSRGEPLPNRRRGVSVNGHDDVFHDNIIARNQAGGVGIIDMTFNDEGTNHPPEKTLGNRLFHNTFYGNLGRGPEVDIVPLDRQNPNDAGDRDNGPHRELNYPEFTGLGVGEVYGTACVGCKVHLYLSGTILADGTVDLTRNDGSVGAAWFGTAAADASGRFSLADDRITVARTLWALAIDEEGNTSEWTADGIVVPSTPFGIAGDPQPSLPPEPRPAPPALPRPHIPVLPDRFTCNYADATLSWTDAGADEYYVVATTNGTSTYLGAATGTSLVTQAADTYEVTHYRHGRAVAATCGQPLPSACTSIIFRDLPIRSFGGQDNGSSEIIDGGNGLRVLRNGWKAVDLEHRITRDTVLEFDFRSGVRGEEHAIGFSNVLDGAAAGQRFKLYGSQNTDGDALQDFATYVGDGTVQRFVIPVGTYLRGEFAYLLLTADDDATAAGQSEFSNIRLYDGDDSGCGDDPEPDRAAIGGLVASADLDPQADIAVDLFLQAPDGSRGAFLASTRTGTDGRYRFDNLDGRCYVVTFIAPEGEVFDNGSRWLLNAPCVDAGENRTDVDATLAGRPASVGTLTGTLTLVGGDPVEGVTASLYEASADGARGRYIVDAFTGPDGVYRFEVAAGCYRVDLVAPAGTSFGGQRYRQLASCVEVGEVSDGLDGVLSPEGELATLGGSVTRADGSPVAGVAINLFRTAADGSRGAYLGEVRTGGDGRYAFDVEAVCYTLTFIAPDGETFGGSRWFQPTRCPSAGEVIDDIDGVLD